MRILAGILATAFLLAGGAAQAVDVQMAGTNVTVKSGLVKLTAKPGGGNTLPADAANDPTSVGAELRILDTTPPGAGTNTYNLPSTGWSRIPKKTTKPLKGYKYKGSGSSTDPCKSITLKASVVKANCKSSAVTLNPPFSGNVGVILTIGEDTRRFCAQFPPTKQDDTQTKGKNAPPAACAVPATPTTTTSTTATTLIVPTTTTSTTTQVSSTSTTTTDGATTTSTTLDGSTTTSTTLDGSTTTSTTTVGSSTTSTTGGGGGCCNGAGFIGIVTADAPGDCGDISSVVGTKIDLACSGLFTGGGGNSVPLPYTIPDQGKAVSKITSCTGQTATLGATTSAETGSNNNCTGVGCLFGGPLAVPNPGSTPTSVCVLNRISGELSGTAVCDTGATTASLPLGPIIYLTGDSLAGEAGIQPCPLCNAMTCSGGPNNGMACEPGTSDLGDEYPTSQDCPPDPMTNIGTLPISFALTSGTITWQATTATNDSETEANASRVFSGFCRDKDITTNFATPAQLCWENGMAVGAACAGSFETCEQRGNGAFGPGGGGTMTITAIGSAESLLAGPADGHLVGIFSIPPTSDATVNAAGDLPGPGAVAIPGTATLCTAANDCPPAP